MVKFFVPDTDSPEESEKFYALIRSMLIDQGATLSDRRIYSITFHHNRKPHSAKVGCFDTRFGEQVVAIFELELAGLCYICTPRRGVPLGSLPYHAVSPYHIEDFEVDDTKSA